MQKIDTNGQSKLDAAFRIAKVIEGCFLEDLRKRLKEFMEIIEKKEIDNPVEAYWFASSNLKPITSDPFNDERFSGYEYVGFYSTLGFLQKDKGLVDLAILPPDHHAIGLKMQDGGGILVPLMGNVECHTNVGEKRYLLTKMSDADSIYQLQPEEIIEFEKQREGAILLRIFPESPRMKHLEE